MVKALPKGDHSRPPFNGKFVSFCYVTLSDVNDITRPLILGAVDERDGYIVCAVEERKEKPVAKNGEKSQEKGKYSIQLIGRSVIGHSATLPNGAAISDALLSQLSVQVSALSAIKLVAFPYFSKFQGLIFS